MLAGRLKWWRWLGAATPDGGTVGTYEGAGYYRYGMYRPSQDSLMHTLGIAKGGNPYNAPSAEEMVDHFYRKLKPVDSATPQGAAAAGTVLRVTTLQPATHALDVRWAVDGAEVAEARGQRTFAITPELAEARAEVTATVADLTPFVRNPAYLSTHLTQTLRWTI
jgi:hypothetical protein